MDGVSALSKGHPPSSGTALGGEENCGPAYMVFIE